MTSSRRSAGDAPDGPHALHGDLCGRYQLPLSLGRRPFLLLSIYACDDWQDATTAGEDVPVCSAGADTYLDIKVGHQVYKLTNVHVQIDAYVSDVVRPQLPTLLLDEAFGKKDDMPHAIQHKFQEEMTAYVFQIHKSLVTEPTVKALVDHSNTSPEGRRARAHAPVLRGGRPGELH
jgi:hypothetical protein